MKKNKSTQGIQVTVGGDVNAQFAAGHNIKQVSTSTTTAVTSVVVYPIVGKLVEAGGDALVGEFRRRFGDTSS